MPDITFDDLVNAKNAAQPKPSGDGGFLSDMTQDGLMNLGTMALNVLEKFQSIQQAKGGVIASRSPANQTTSQQEVNKPMVDVAQIKEALNMVKMAKGDITITAMLRLIEENEETVAKLIKDV